MTRYKWFDLWLHSTVALVVGLVTMPFGPSVFIPAETAVCSFFCGSELEQRIRELAAERKCSRSDIPLTDAIFKAHWGGKSIADVFGPQSAALFLIGIGVYFLGWFGWA